MIALLAVLIAVAGCSIQEAKLEEAQLTIKALETEVLALKKENASLRAHEEMAIGEVAFAQGCALWINLCFGKDAIGHQLMQQGLSAQGSTPFFLWMASKIVFLCLALTAMAASSIVFMHRWIEPSATRLREAQSIIDQASLFALEIEKSKALLVAKVQAADASIAKAQERASQQIEAAKDDVLFHEMEVERLQELIHQLKGEITALDLARSVAAGFSNGRR